MSGLTAFKLLRIQPDFTISFHLCCDAYRLRSKLFAVNFPMDVGSEDIAAFLRAGVPAELTRAALRRAWISDRVAWLQSQGRAHGLAPA
jgi:hypothetical protein